MWKSKFYGAFVLNRRVDLHAIDATPARWRGGAGSSSLDRARTAASSPRNDLVHPTHWLISTQRPTIGRRLTQCKFSTFTVFARRRDPERRVMRRQERVRDHRFGDDRDLRGLYGRFSSRNRLCSFTRRVGSRAATSTASRRPGVTTTASMPLEVRKRSEITLSRHAMLIHHVMHL